MKKQAMRSLMVLCLGAGSANAQAQLSFSDVAYWVGSGSDSSVLVVDFKDASWDSSYAWGFLHNGNATAEQMLNAIAAVDPNFSINTNGGFLNDLNYGNHSGIGGTNGFYWSTWSGTHASNWSMNSGIGESLANGDWFGCAFTDFNPALAPGNPIPAFDPARFTAQEVDFWVGSGSDSSILVIDFLDGTGSASFAWGYAYSGIQTGEQMLNAIAAADPMLSVAMAGGFLNDITYGSYSGIGGNPNFWGTWSATNLGNWDFNIGIGDTLQNGSFFGCSYTDFSPALRPGYPSAATPVAGMEAKASISLGVYPNPSSDFLYLASKGAAVETWEEAFILDLSGRRLWHQSMLEASTPISIQHLPAGTYFLMLKQGNTLHSAQFLKQ